MNRGRSAYDQSDDDADEDDLAGPQLWVQTVVFAVLAVGAAVAAARTHGWVHVVMIALTVLLGALAVWVSLFALFFTGLFALIKSDRRTSVAAQIYWWVWVVGGVMIGTVAGAGVYVDGPADLVGVPLGLLGVAVVSRDRIRADGRKRVLTCLAVIAITSTLVGLTIFR